MLSQRALEAAASKCEAGHGSSAGLVVIAAMALPVGIALILRLVRSRAADQQRWLKATRFAIAGSVVAFVGDLSYLLSQHQQCGPNSMVATVGLITFYAGALFAIVSLAAGGKASWAMTAISSVFDLSLLLGIASSAPEVAVIIGVHAVACAVSAVWAYQIREADRSQRALVGETGRNLIAAWLGIGLVWLLSELRPHGPTDPAITGLGTAVIGAFSFAAVVTVMGSGYTRYVQAFEAVQSTGATIQPVWVFGRDLAEPVIAVAAKSRRAIRRAVRTISHLHGR